MAANTARVISVAASFGDIVSDRVAREKGAARFDLFEKKVIYLCRVKTYFFYRHPRQNGQRNTFQS